MAIEENVWRKDECQDENERRRDIISKGVWGPEPSDAGDACDLTEEQRIRRGARRLFHY